MRVDLLDDFSVTPAARIFRDGEIHRRYLNWLMKALRGERNRVVPSVDRFDGPLADRIMGGMAVVADGNEMMTGFYPCIEVVSHHMAVGTCLGIIREVGAASGIPEHVNADSSAHSHSRCC